MLVVLSVILSALLQLGGLNCTTHAYVGYGAFPVQAGDTVTVVASEDARIWIGVNEFHLVRSATILVRTTGLLEVESSAGKDPSSVTLQHCSPQPALPPQSAQLPVAGLAGFLPLFIFIVIALGIGAMFRSAR